MEIKNKTEHDPVADLYLPDFYMRWTLLAAEEIVGKLSMRVVLREAGLGRLIDNYPLNEAKAISNITFGDYGSLNASLLSIHERAGKDILLRIGQVIWRHWLEQPGTPISLASIVVTKALPIPAQLKIGMESLQEELRMALGSIGQDLRSRVENRGDKLAWVGENCPYCAGKQATKHICMMFAGTLQQGVGWLTGKKFEVEEVECRAMGAPACVFEVSKIAKE